MTGRHPTPPTETAPLRGIPETASGTVGPGRVRKPDLGPDPSAGGCRHGGEAPSPPRPTAAARSACPSTAPGRSSSRSRCRARRTDSRPRARRPASSPRPRPAARAVTAPAASSQPVSLGPPDRLGHRVGAADRAAHIPADRRQTSQPFEIATGRCLPARARRDLLRLRLGRCPLPLDRLPRSAPWRTRSRKRRSPSARTNGSRSIRCGTPTRRT